MQRVNDKGLLGNVTHCRIQALKTKASLYESPVSNPRIAGHYTQNNNIARVCQLMEDRNVRFIDHTVEGRRILLSTVIPTQVFLKYGKAMKKCGVYFLDQLTDYETRETRPWPIQVGGRDIRGKEKAWYAPVCRALTVETGISQVDATQQEEEVEDITEVEEEDGEEIDGEQRRRENEKRKEEKRKRQEEEKRTRKEEREKKKQEEKEKKQKDKEEKKRREEEGKRKAKEIEEQTRVIWRGEEFGVEVRAQNAFIYLTDTELAGRSMEERKAYSTARNHHTDKLIAFRRQLEDTMRHQSWEGKQRRKEEMKQAKEAKARQREALKEEMKQAKETKARQREALKEDARRKQRHKVLAEVSQIIEAHQQGQHQLKPF
ncbi:hypothetical protein EDD21DRAFT_25946 [Dissophora ornata]|nr:hypothetical protein EDD21DRAFT_25946 [Dissophora ornata]